MKVVTVPLLLLMLAALGQDPSRNEKVDLGVEFNIKNGQEVVVRDEKLHITFSSVLLDSRCPTGVVCGWAGNGEIVIEVARKNKRPVAASLNTLLDPKVVEYKSYKIKLVSLNPYPIYGHPIDPADYEATLVVTKE